MSNRDCVVRLLDPGHRNAHELRGTCWEAGGAAPVLKPLPKTTKPRIKDRVARVDARVEGGGGTFARRVVKKYEAAWNPNRFKIPSNVSEFRNEF